MKPFVPSRLSAAAIIAAILLAHVPAQADWTLTTADFAAQKGLTVNTWNLAEGLSVTGQSGKLLKVETRNVLSLASGRPPPVLLGGGAAWRMGLRDGDVLYGEPVRVSGQSIEFKTVDAGTLAVPLKLVTSIAAFKTVDPGAASEGSGPVHAAESPADTDVVRLKNNDVVKGLIADVNGHALQLAASPTDTTTTSIDMSSVERLVFGGVAAPRTMPALSARITFASGSVLTIPLDEKQKSFIWTVNDITFKDLAGQERKITADAIASIDITGGKVVCLTEFDPEKDDQSTFIGTRWPTQVNKNVLGQPLKVGKTTYAGGLGVHTRSDIVYDLGGGFDTFKFRVGMDDSAAPQGMADVSVLLDGKVIWQGKNLKATGAAVDGAKGNEQISDELSLSIKGGKKLELRADPALAGGKIDVLGRVDWLHVALVRP